MAEALDLHGTVTRHLSQQTEFPETASHEERTSLPVEIDGAGKIAEPPSTWHKKKLWRVDKNRSEMTPDDFFELAELKLLHNDYTSRARHLSVIRKMIMTFNKTMTAVLTVPGISSNLMEVIRSYILQFKDLKDDIDSEIYQQIYRANSMHTDVLDSERRVIIPNLDGNKGLNFTSALRENLIQICGIHGLADNEPHPNQTLYRVVRWMDSKAASYSDIVPIGNVIFREASLKLWQACINKQEIQNTSESVQGLLDTFSYNYPKFCHIDPFLSTTSYVDKNGETIDQALNQVLKHLKQEKENKETEEQIQLDKKKRMEALDAFVEEQRKDPKRNKIILQYCEALARAHQFSHEEMVTMMVNFIRTHETDLIDPTEFFDIFREENGPRAIYRTHIYDEGLVWQTPDSATRMPSIDEIIYKDESLTV